jgi:L-aminopeptidase/D-esterase-like protein
MSRPGARNLITDVPGILVGNAEDHRVRSGCTVVLAERPAIAAVDVRGGAPGTRETEALNATCLAGRADAVVLSGGSAFGLDAAGGVMAWLAAKGRGFKVGEAAVPIVPAAILFDLLNGGDKAWGDEPPYRALGRLAVERAGADFALGNAGAGLGARAGRLKGGLGSASARFELTDSRPAITLGALAAVNALGEATMPGSDAFWAWPFEQAREFGGRRPNTGSAPPALPPTGVPGANTTLVVVATDAALTQAEAERVAIMAQDGIARALHPAHTPFDGDIVFALSTGMHELEARPADLFNIGCVAADCTARAIARGVFEASDLGDLQSYRSLHKGE